ncbi:MAG: DMT family transporter [Cytophagales bacterium]|nr:MAG: DMT family transporter [Cytophagales bacterium]
MGNYLFFFLTLLAGILVAVQTAVNSQLRLALDNPILASVISFAVGFSALLIFLMLSRPTGVPTLASFSQIAWWKWIGGLLGAFYIVVSILSAPKIGATNFAALLIAGQLISSLFLDHFGWMGFRTQPIDWTKIGGAVCLILGVYLITKK